MPLTSSGSWRSTARAETPHLLERRNDMRTHHLPLLAAGLLAAAATSAHADLTHRFSFNNPSDSVGGLGGTLINGATIAGGQLVFDPAINDGLYNSPATGQYLDLPIFPLTRKLTIETWATYLGGADWQRLADFGNNSTGRKLGPGNEPPAGTNYFGVGFAILTPQNRNGLPLGQVSINTSGQPVDTDFVQGNTPIKDRAQHHYVFTHDPDAGFEVVYLDGAEIGRAPARFDPSLANYRNYWIGRSNFSDDPFYHGSVSEFRTYDTALTGDEVAANFALGPDAVVPEPSALALTAAGALLLRRRH